MKISYTPSVESDAREALVSLRKNESEMGDRTAVSLWVGVLAGKGTLQVHLLDKTSFSRFHSQPIECTWKGWKKIVLDRKDFGLTEENEKDWKEWWGGVKRLQFSLHGTMDLILDHIQYTSP